MDTPEIKWIERAVKAETQAKFLYEALQKIKNLSGYDRAYYIAEAASAGYTKPESELLQ
jgi:uncharacterized protein YmfQ (DUF2313 family)